MAEVQVYNGRSNRWVLMDDEKKGGFIKMQREKFEGVPVKDSPEKPEKKKDPEPPPAVEDSPPPKSDSSLSTEQNEPEILEPETPPESEPEKSGGWLGSFGW